MEGGGPQVTEQDIANIVAQWTGIPIEKVRGVGGWGGGVCVRRICDSRGLEKSVSECGGGGRCGWEQGPSYWGEK